MNKITLELNHKRNNPRNSEGSFITLKSGRILFIYTHYYGKSGADHGTANLGSRYSDDGGRTWSKRDQLVLKNEGKCNVMSVSLLRLQNGRIGMWYMRKNSIADCRTYMRTSRDEGKTWSRAKLCIPAPGYFVTNNDRVIQLADGRLVVPAALHRNRLPAAKAKDHVYAAFDSRGIAMFYLSDDNGRSWRESEDWWAAPRRCASGLQEPGVVELDDGRLWAWCRTDLGCQYQMFSRNGGDRWTIPAKSPFISPRSPLSMKRIPKTGDLLAVWNDHSGRLPTPEKTAAQSSWGRTPLVAAISKDEGQTWQHRKVLEDDPTRGFCYITIHFTDDAALLAYCCGGGKRGGVLQDTCIRRVDLGWLYS